MSTILDALRKAKNAPQPEKPVDARREVLNEKSHDYLAQVPGEESDNRVFFLWGFIVFCLMAIGILSAVVLWLAFSRGDVADSALTENPPQVAASPSAESEVIEVREILRAPEKQVSESAMLLPVRDAIEVQPVTVPSPPTQASASAADIVPVEVETSPAESPVVTSESDRLYRVTISRLNGLKIEGILWDKKSPMAMVDGKMIQVGSRIDAATVKAIHPDSIVFVIGEREFVLRQ